jgi:hypothetical protein
MRCVARRRSALEPSQAMADAEQSFSEEIDAPIESCVEVLLDFAAYPQWSSPILETSILASDDQGRPTQVAFALDMKIRTVRYTLAYEYDLPGSARWHLVDGDLAAVEGSYAFEALAQNRTRATCSQSVDIGFWIPGPIRRIFERQALRDSVLEFKAEAERRRG